MKKKYVTFINIIPIIGSQSGSNYKIIDGVTTRPVII